MTETSPGNNSSRRYLLFGWVLCVLFCILSIFAMNDLWKCYVDQKFASTMSFGDPMRFCNSGTTYMNCSLIALALALLVFFIHWRKAGSSGYLFSAIVAVALVLVGCLYLFKSEPTELMFMDYIEHRFVPFWAFAIGSIFVVRCVAVILSQRLKVRS